MSLDSAFSGDTYTTCVSSGSGARDALAHEVVDGGEERGERLAGARWARR